MTNLKALAYLGRRRTQSTEIAVKMRKMSRPYLKDSQ